MGFHGLLVIGGVLGNGGFMEAVKQPNLWRVSIVLAMLKEKTQYYDKYLHVVEL